MKQSIALLALLLVGTSSFAQTHKSTAPKAIPVIKTVEEPIQAPESPFIYSPIVVDGHQFGADFGVGLVDPKFFLGLGLRLEFPVIAGTGLLRFGVQTGFNYGPSSPSMWVIPALASGSYQFNIAGSLKPYMGIAMGAAISHTSALTVTKTSTDFMFLFKPGFMISHDDKYYFEIPVGTIDGVFTLLPCIGVHL